MNVKLFIAVSILAFLACDTTEKHQEKGSGKEVEKVEKMEKENTENINLPTVIEKDGLRLHPAPSEAEYPTAKLELQQPKGKNLAAGLTNFNFEVLDYKLKDQTAAEKTKTLANSEKGQHIHFILNNAPYQAKYEPSFDAGLLEGNNVVLAFLSKSFHESVKTETAYFFDNFYVGEGENDFNKEGQHLFYSRPKGEYKKEKAEKLLVDFYLINTSLSQNGNKVKLTVDDSAFLLSDWKAYFLEGLEVGEHNFRIQLVDNDGNLIEGPFNDSGVRVITIVE